MVGHTWKYVNKSGGPDKRFKDNRQIPVARYGVVHLTSPSGLNELLYTSAESAPLRFAHALLPRIPALLPPAPSPPPSPVAASPGTWIDLTQQGAALEIVGESYRKAAVRKVAASGAGEVGATFHVAVIPEPDNTHDVNAIRVWVTDIGTVGYLSRQDALRYREVAHDLLRLGLHARCEAFLVGRPPEEYDIRLRLMDPATCRAAIAAQVATTGRAP